MAASEIHFVVEEAPEGGYIARAINEDIAMPCIVISIPEPCPA